MNYCLLDVGAASRFYWKTPVTLLGNRGFIFFFSVMYENKEFEIATKLVAKENAMFLHEEIATFVTEK